MIPLRRITVVCCTAFASLLPLLAFASSPDREPAALTLAYIDPGAGSFVVQALVAMIAGIAVTGRIYWAKIKSMLGIAAAADDDDDIDDD